MTSALVDHALLRNRQHVQSAELCLHQWFLLEGLSIWHRFAL